MTVDRLGEAREELERAVGRLHVDHVEDELTEALRLTLDGNGHLARAPMLASGVTLPGTRLEFEAVSQWGFAVIGEPGRRRTTDLRLTAFDRGRPVGRLWVEKKLYAPEGPRQLEDQWRALHAEKPMLAAQQLVSIVLRRKDRDTVLRKARAEGFDVHVFRRLDIEDLVIAAGLHTGRNAGATFRRRRTNPVNSARSASSCGGSSRKTLSRAYSGRDR